MLTRVRVRNYKSLADVDVELGPLTVLVGQNSTGKSNFVDALHFLSDAVTVGLDETVSRRGGAEVIRCVVCQPHYTGISFDLHFEFGEEAGEYHLELAEKDAEYQVKREKAVLGGTGYESQQGRFNWIGDGAKQPLPWGDQTRLLLPLLSTGTNDFRIWDFLDGIGYYSVFPDLIRDPQRIWPPGRLANAGYNLSSVLRHIQKDHPDVFQRLRDALVAMVPGIKDIDIEMIRGYLFVKLLYQYGDEMQGFHLSQESDGTVRLLTLLTALYQVPTPSLITIEEPELAVHPGALKMLYEVIEEASERTQIIITTHSPDLISYSRPEDIRLVEKVKGVTKISPLEQRQIDIVNDQLFSTSDLLRIEGLRPQRPS